MTSGSKPISAANSPSSVLPQQLFRYGGGSSDRPGSMPLLVEAEGAPAQNCYRMVVLGSAKVGKTALVDRFLNNRFNDKYTPTIEDFHRKIYRIRGEAYRLDILDTSGNNPFPAMKRLSLLTGDLFVLVYSIESRESFDEVERLVHDILEAKGHSHHQNYHYASHYHPLHNSSPVSTTSLPAAFGMSKSGSGSPISSGAATPPGVASAPIAAACTCSSGRSGRSSSTKNSPPIVIVGNKMDRESTRVVALSELVRLVESVPQCAGIETSAKQNINIEEVFVRLFVLGRLPTEMSPSLHRRVPPNYVGGASANSSRARDGNWTEAVGQETASTKAAKKSDGLGRRIIGTATNAGGALLSRRRTSDACGAVAPNVRRPSIRTDLLLLQTRRNHAAGIGGLAGSGLGLTLGLGTAATVAGVCAGVGGRGNRPVIDGSGDDGETQTSGFEQDVDDAEDDDGLVRKSENGNRNGNSKLSRINSVSADDFSDKRFSSRARRFETDSGSSKCILQ